MKIKCKKGSVLLMWALILGTFTAVGINSIISQEHAKSKCFQEMLDNERLVYMAERGVYYAIIELQMHGFNWFTHYVQTNGNLSKMPNSDPDRAKNPQIQGAVIQSANPHCYLPFGDDSVQVKIYRTSPTSSIRWIVSKAVLNGKTKIVRASINADSLYNYFVFINHSWRPRWGATFDGRGFGKMYINGDITMNHATFKNIALLSTNSNGVIKALIGRKYTPYDWDDEDGVMDGYNLLLVNPATENNLPFDDAAIYPSEKVLELYRGYPNPIHYWNNIFEMAPSASPDYVFTFKFDVQGQGQVTLKPPLHVKKPDKTPALYSCRTYVTKTHDEVPNEKPLQFARLYYRKKVNGVWEDAWHITADPTVDPDPSDNSDGVQLVAQVFDGINTATGKDENGIQKKPALPTIHYGFKNNGTIQYKDIPVNENIRSIYKDDDNNNIIFNPDYEKKYWGNYYNDPRHYALYGYYRGDDPTNLSYGSVHWDDYKDVDFLDTSQTTHAEAFNKWVNADYDRDDNDIYNNDGKINLYGIIKERNTGAKDLNMVEIENTFSSSAREGGVWIGYEAGQNNSEVLKAYINGSEINIQNVLNENDPWLKVESFITGVACHSGGINPGAYSAQIKHAETITIDVKKLSEKYNLDSTNGIIWINNRPSGTVNQVSSQRGVKIKNADNIPRAGGLTFVSPNPVFIQGDLNYKANDNTYQWQPTSVISDSEIYLLSKSANLPAYDPDNPESNAPAYSDPYLPEIGDMLRYLHDYAINNGYSSDFADHLWPNPNDDEATKDQKLDLIDDAVKAFFNNRPDKAFCKPSDDLDIKTDLPKYSDYLANPSRLISCIKDSFASVHNPLNPENGYKAAMPLVAEGESDFHIYASLVNPDRYGKSITLENWRWSNVNRNLNINIRGMAPNVRGKTSDHWSNFYTKDGMFRGSTYDSHCWNHRTITAENYSDAGEYPPGDLTMTYFETWYITDDQSFFTQHKTTS